MTTKQQKTNSKELCLKEICFQAVRQRFAALGIEDVLDLPRPLIKELLPHLTVCQLDELQPALNQRGISTHSEWIGILQEMCGPNHVVDFHTEEEAKHEVMKMLFSLVFYNFTNAFVKRNLTNLNTPSFLWAAAKCIKHFLLSTKVDSLITERRPILDLFEKRILSVGVSQFIDLSKRETQPALYVLHRLLDHGVAKKVVVQMHCPVMLSWILHGRGSQYVSPQLKKLLDSKKDSCISQAASANVFGASCSSVLETRASEDQDDQGTPCKRPKLSSGPVEESGKANFTVDPHILCQLFSPCGGTSTESCPAGQIDSLEIRQCRSNSLRVLISALPTFFCLRSLTLHSFSILRDSVVCNLATALKQLYESSHSSLTNLSISILPCFRFMETLLDASPNVTSLLVDIETVMWAPLLLTHQPCTAESDTSELPLKKLVVKVADLQTDLRFLTSVLRRSPHLTSLHIAAMRLPPGSSQSQLLTTLSDSNPLLKSLTLEDVKLSDCFPDILDLLRDCKLEELCFNDCRLLEKSSNREESLQQLVAALKTVPTLHTLSLAQNRLAKSVCVLAELFSGSSVSSVKHLDISSNFIQPAELLELAKRLKTHHPPHRLTLDLRKNPGDRDPDTWGAALRGLRPFCVLLVEDWSSTDTMADHISNM